MFSAVHYISDTCSVRLHRVVCPNFGHPALTSSFNKSPFESWNNFKTDRIHSKLLQNYFSHAKFKILIWQENVRSLDRVSEVWTGCPKLGHTTLFTYCMFSSVYYLSDTCSVRLHIKGRKLYELSIHGVWGKPFIGGNNIYLGKGLLYVEGW